MSIQTIYNAIDALLPDLYPFIFNIMLLKFPPCYTVGPKWEHDEINGAKTDSPRLNLFNKKYVKIVILWNLIII